VTRPLRLLVVPLVALFALGAVEATPHGPAVPAARHAPASVAVWAPGSADQAILPAHSVRDTGSSQRPSGLVPAAPPRLLPLGPVAGAVVGTIPPLPVGSFLGVSPRAPPSFA
jgi:hypothetical protein